MTQAADFYESGTALWFTDSDDVQREYVPRFVYERVADRLREKLEETVAFGRAHGLTDEMWDEWKAR